MIVKLLTEQHLEYLSLRGGCRGSSESTHASSESQNGTLLEISCAVNNNFFSILHVCSDLFYSNVNYNICITLNHLTPKNKA